MIINFKKKRFLASSTYLLDNFKVFSSIFLILILISCFFIDKPLATFFFAMPSIFKDLFGLIEKIFCPIFWIVITQSAFFYVRFILRREKKSRKLWYVSMAIVLSIFLAKIIDLSFGRANPEWFFLHQESPFRFFEWNNSFHSFPSITSVTIATFATSLSCVISKARSYLLLAAFVLSFIPVLSTSCFLSDALAGFYVGTIAAQWIFQKMRKEISF